MLDIFKKVFLLVGIVSLIAVITFFAISYYNYSTKKPVTVNVEKHNEPVTTNSAKVQENNDTGHSQELCEWMKNNNITFEHPEKCFIKYIGKNVYFAYDYEGAHGALFLRAIYYNDKFNDGYEIDILNTNDHTHEFGQDFYIQDMIHIVSGIPTLNGDQTVQVQFTDTNSQQLEKIILTLAQNGEFCTIYYDKQLQDEEETEEVGEENEEETSDDIYVDDLQLIDQYQSKTEDCIEGHIINNSNTTYTSVYVEILFYDFDGNVIGDSIDSISNLSPNETWLFKANLGSINSSNCKNYKITNIKGYN